MHRYKLKFNIARSYPELFHILKAALEIKNFFKSLWQKYLLRKFKRMQVINLSNNLKIKISRENGYIDEQIFLSREWSHGLINTLLENVRSDSIVLDVGANIGYMTLHLSQKCLDGHVYSFEPVRSLYEQLQTNVEINNFENNCTLLNIALGNVDEAGTVLKNTKNMGMSSIVRSEKVSSENENIIIKKLDSIDLNVENIDLIKVDVEGFEYEFLKGAEKTIKNHMPILVIEYSPALLSSDEQHDLVEFLYKMGYKIYDVRSGSRYKDLECFPFDALQLLGQTDLLCKPPRK